MAQKTFIDSATKFCPGCGETKPRNDFHKSNHTLHGLGVYCKVCEAARREVWRLANKDKCAAQSKRWREAHPRAAKDHSLRARYGLPLGGYEKMFADQQGKCACCGTTDPGGRGDFHVDHCHNTGSIRGLLCHGCNVSIGHFDHDPKLLERAIDYLTRTQS